MHVIISNLNAFDYGLLILLLCSTLWGFKRGLFAELFALVTWSLAFGLAIGFTSFINQYLQWKSLPHAPLLSFSVIFIVVVIVGGIINFLLRLLISMAQLSFMNRLLASGVGLLKGIIFVVFIVFIFNSTSLATTRWFQSSIIAFHLTPVNGWIQKFLATQIQKTEIMKHRTN